MENYYQGEKYGICSMLFEVHTDPDAISWESSSKAAKMIPICCKWIAFFIPSVSQISCTKSQHSLILVRVRWQLSVKVLSPSLFLESISLEVWFVFVASMFSGSQELRHEAGWLNDRQIYEYISAQSACTALHCMTRLGGGKVPLSLVFVIWSSRLFGLCGRQPPIK